MSKVIFKHSDEAYIYKPLLDAINKLCADKGKDCTCTSGYRSLAKQKIINAQVLASAKGNNQDNNPKSSMYGAVRNKAGVCIAGAYGKSNHCFGLALDITDTWFKALTDADLKPYGLHKPVVGENWHVQLIATYNYTQKQKEAIRNSILKGNGEDMTIKEFQSITGLVADGIVGAKTIAKAKEVQEVVSQILKGGK
jgi:hypothetical protein